MCGETKLLIETEPEAAHSVAWQIRGLAALLGLDAVTRYDPAQGEVEIEFWALLDRDTGVELSCFCFYDDCPDLQEALRTFLVRVLAGTTGRVLYYANAEWCDDTRPPQALSVDEALTRYRPGDDCSPLLLTRDGIAFAPLPDGDVAATSGPVVHSGGAEPGLSLEDVLDFGGASS